ncbi:MAG TPA: hypothetical protein VFQ25_16250 [Ktedonobacterales bacterium]|nr:hypothetical protein [Ktedonobacterales bacterium]
MFRRSVGRRDSLPLEERVALAAQALVVEGKRALVRAFAMLGRSWCLGRDGEHQLAV